MRVNSSLDFLNMIKAQTSDEQGKREHVKRAVPEPETKVDSETSSVSGDMIAVIDTETNWHDEVMSIGVALADAITYKCLDKRYYILEPECRIGGMYASVMYRGVSKALSCSRNAALSDIADYLHGRNVSRIFAYNAKFDLGHLPELSGFQWYDIMKVAAYRQYNPFIPEDAECCKTGRLKGNYGVEPIMKMLTGNVKYCETHNAILDACDELKIVELLGLDIDMYECARI